MLSEDKENKLFTLFIAIDDFCLALEDWKQHQAGFCKSVTNSPVMSDSEMLTILVFYQYADDQHCLSGYSDSISLEAAG